MKSELDIYEKICVGCENEIKCHENCVFCEEYELLCQEIKE